MKPLRAFSTLGASALLLLIVAFAALSVGQASESLAAEERTKRALSQRDEAWQTLRTVVEEFREGWRPDVQEWVAFAQQQTWSTSIEFVDLSARLNVNTVNTFLLGDSRLKELLTGTVDAFATLRREKGPFRDLEALEEVFTEEARRDYLTVWSVADVNTVDEVSAEELASLRTGQDSVGITLRDALRAARLERRVWDRLAWQTQLALIDPKLEGLFGAEPELNVNTAPEFLLEALLTYPALEVAEPAAKLAQLVSGRESRPWTTDTLAQVLQVEKDARVLQYLGTRSSFLQGRFEVEGRTFQFVLHRGDAEAGTPSIRVVAQGWVS